VGTVEAVGTVVQYSKRLLLQARRLGAAGGAEFADISAVFGQDLFRVKPLAARLQLLATDLPAPAVG
jgi:hypothetical protein